MKIAILASHNGSTLQAVIDACESGALQSDVALVISNNSTSGAMQRAQKHGIETLHLSSKTNPNNLDQAICAALLDRRIDCVLLAGYMKRIGPEMLSCFHGQIFNTHPSLLPKYGGEAYYGRRIYEAVLAAGETETGVTFHHASDEYDAGQIVSQVPVPILKDDTVATLEQRVQDEEKVLIITVLKTFESRKPQHGDDKNEAQMAERQTRQLE